MSKQITVTLPEGYEKTTHLVLVAPDLIRNNMIVVDYAVNVLRVEGDNAERVVEEVGSGPLRDLMIDAARVVRTGTAVVKK